MNNKKRFYPDFFYKRVQDISKDFFKKNGIRFAVLDIDNTLVPYTVEKPTAEALDFLHRLESEGVRYCFLSNNSKNRVEIFNKDINAPWVSNAKKPLRFGIKRALEILKADAESTLVIGDQVFTDVWCAKRIGAKSMLVLPIEDKETAFFKCKRALEKLALKNYKGENPSD